MDCTDYDMAFIKGASDGLVESGADINNPAAIDVSARLLCKVAKSARDDDDTFWGRNKGWILPTLIGLGAFHVGGIVGRSGRPDKSMLSNLGDAVANALFGSRVRYGAWGDASDEALYGPTDVGRHKNV